MDDFYYRKLNVYHKSKELVASIYKICDSFPQTELYALGNQLQRAAISVPSNIAEGMGRFSLRERMHFLEIAYGSAMETMCQTEIACMLGYISKESFESIEILIAEISKMLLGLRKNIEEKNNNKQQ